jgi:N-acetylglucosaminyl-diphospho-decaprenol L-rhamnosyltransferase
MNPELSIIIVNYKSAAFVEACLQSIYRTCASIALEVIVVDNASGDHCGEMLRTKFPNVKFVASPHNSGFAAANNLGFEHSRGRKVLLLNPDTVVFEDAIFNMMHALERCDSAGLVGPKLLNSDGSIQTTCVRRFPSLLNELLASDALRRWFPRMSIWGMRPLFDGASAPVRVEAVSGACMMLHRDVFVRVGHLSTEYFMYGEDIDLCYKVAQVGAGVYYLPDSVVVHHGGGSSSISSNFSAIQERASMLQFMRMRRGEAYALAYRAGMGLVAVIRLVLLYLLYLARPRQIAVRRAISKWTAILLWTVGVQSAIPNLLAPEVG